MSNKDVNTELTAMRRDVRAVLRRKGMLNESTCRFMRAMVWWRAHVLVSDVLYGGTCCIKLLLSCVALQNLSDKLFLNLALPSRLKSAACWLTPGWRWRDKPHEMRDVNWTSRQVMVLVMYFWQLGGRDGRGRQIGHDVTGYCANRETGLTVCFQGMWRRFSPTSEITSR